ncbi:MAG: hypothetical protein Nkreftii_001381 [Candidatus Nitrospira kreftii]|uniref:Uncharacterized protein n=1 Tax=Candidatus Nitrospira kreftii TaxID=2652173 RepID=A0A7S8FD48_9BACT|nr:MAG: hypothetical protein Nkreftii_001381 [Candidatus Nitrospira kreftii]
MRSNPILNPQVTMSNRDYIAKVVRGTWAHALFDVARDIKKQLLRRAEGQRILLERFERTQGRSLKISNPESFSEKLYCRMIALNRISNPHFTRVSDKFAARAYVADKIGEHCLVKLLWHGEDPGTIPFDNLPAEYVIKTNHGSAQVIVVKRQPDREEIANRLAAWLRRNYYWAAREGQYYHIKPRIMIEEYLRHQDGRGPLDYRFWCFGGVPEVIQVDNHAHDINPFFDAQWNLLDLYYRDQAARPYLAKPKNFEHMLDLASRLSAGFDFVRVDLYNIDGNIYFGEFTLTPTSGHLKLRPDCWDVKLGEKWKMSTVSGRGAHL